jgi:hypothetical protein
VKTIAFLFGLCIAAVGAVGIVKPTALAWIAQYFVTAGSFYFLAAVRIAFGLVLIVVAPASRVPGGLRVLGYVIVILGITTAVTALVALDRAGVAIDWWLEQSSTVARLTSLPVLLLGAFVAYACAPGAGRTRPTRA